MQAGVALLFWRIIETGDKFGIFVTVANFVSYLLVTAVVTYDRTYRPSAMPAGNVPPGNCIVMDNPGASLLWAINGIERDIQNLLQQNVMSKAGPGFKVFELLVAIFGMLTAVATIVLTPLMGQQAQLWFGAQLALGLFQNMLFSSQVWTPGIVCIHL